MRKLLFATTALFATTGMAAAEITFGGFGRVGVIYSESNTDPWDDELGVEQRFRLTATGQATADNGLEFEGRIRFQADDHADSGAGQISDNSAAGFALTSGSFRLDAGHVSDVVDSGDAFNYYGYGVGLTSFAEQSSGFGKVPASGFDTNSDDNARIAPTVKLRYGASDFTFAVSVTDATADDNEDTPNADVTDRSEYQVGFGYNFGNYSVGAVVGNESTDTYTGGKGTPSNESNNFWVASFGGDLGAFAFTILVGDVNEDGSSEDDHSFGASVKYDIGAATDLRFAFSDSGVDSQDQVAAIGFDHSLGGGVSLKGGFGRNLEGNTVADLGVVFNF